MTLPPEVIAVFREFRTCEFSTIGRDGTPLAWPTSARYLPEQGQFLLKDVVFSLPDDLQPGDTLGYHFATSSKEPFTFMATIFGVPEGCQFKQQ